MIYTITFNPSLDYVMHVRNFAVGETNRSDAEDIFPGGKGFNVSTILARLQLENTAMGFVAGFSGAEIARRLQKRGFHLDLCQLDQGMSRINVKMKGQAETEINGSGPAISHDKLEELFVKLDQLKAGDYLVLAGSIPNSLPSDIYEIIMKRLKEKEISIIVDATKDLLKKVLPHRPFLIKPNHRELEDLFQAQIQDEEQLIYYATKLQEQGARNVLVSLGKDGALLIGEDQHVYFCRGASGTPVNSVGSGDSMVAGFLAGYIDKHDYAYALQLGSACGGATAFSKDLAEKAMIDKVMKQLHAEVIR